MKNAAITGILFGILAGLLLLLTGWIPLFGTILNLAIAVGTFFFALFGGFAVSYLDRRANAALTPASCAASGALFGVIFALTVGLSTLIAFLVRTFIGSAISIGLTGGLAIPLAIIDALGNGALVLLCIFGSIGIYAIIGAAGGAVGALVFKK